MKQETISGVQLTISITNQIGNRVALAQIEVGTDKTYSHEIAAGGSLWKAAGTYTVHVQYGSENRSNETTFEFSGSTGGPSGKTFPVQGTDFSVRYSITGGKILGITIDEEAKSLLIEIETTDPNGGVLTIILPRALIDSKIGTTVEDDNFFVLVDNEESTDFSETEATSTDRTLTIPFVDGTTEIEIIGTWIIPEFGPIAALVLAVAIISIIAVSAKTRLRLMPKY